MDTISKININGTAYQIGGSGGGNISVMGGSGSEHASGLVPDPGSVAGTSKFLREDGTWQIPAEPEIIRGYLYSNTLFYDSEPINKNYVEIGGIKWATVNIGATSITDYGLCFQWGDTQGYTSAQVGSGSGQKYFGWADYKYSNNGGSTAADMTKYNSTDGRTVLNVSDDAARVNWGGKWRIPTSEEYNTLLLSTNSEWITNYNNTDKVVVALTDKTDNTKKLLMVVGNVYGTGSVSNNFRYWSSSLNTNSNNCAWFVAATLSDPFFIGNGADRKFGFSIRAIWDGDAPSIITPSTDKLYIDATTNKMYTYNGSSYVEVGKDISGKEDALTIETISSGTTLTAAANKYYKFTSNVGTLAITLPTMNTSVTKPVGLMLSFTTGSSPAVTISSASSLTIEYFADYAIEASKSYELNCLWNGTKWIIAYGTIG